MYMLTFNKDPVGWVRFVKKDKQFYFVSYKRNSVTDLCVYTICETNIAISFQRNLFFL